MDGNHAIFHNLPNVIPDTTFMADGDPFDITDVLDNPALVHVSMCTPEFDTIILDGV
jgi:hypothetical protein